MAPAEFEPRTPRRRPRLARLAAPRQTLADEAARHGEWPRISGRLDEVAAQLHDGVEGADGVRTRDLLRALVKRVEGARDEVPLVCRLAPYPGDGDREKHRWPLWRGSNNTPLRCPSRWMQDLPIGIQHSRLEPFAVQPQAGALLKAFSPHTPPP